MLELYVIAAVLIGCGLGLAFALGWLRRGAHRRSLVFDEIILLRARFEEDPLAALANCAPWISAAGLTGLRWTGKWYGADVRGQLGRISAESDCIRRGFRQPDVEIHVEAGLAGLRGEARLFAEQAAQWLFVVMDGALAARELALTISMAQRARLAVFVQHDMRNLAQWVALLADDLEAAVSSEELMAQAHRLKKGAQSARDRAGRILATTARVTSAAVDHPASDGHWLDLKLKEELQREAQLHQIELQWKGRWPDELKVRWDSYAWTTVVSNVMGNVSRIARETAPAAPATCSVEWVAHANGGVLTFDTPHLPLRVPLGRIFEPWIGGGQRGSGLGLYQARRAALGAKGELTAYSSGLGVAIVLYVNRKKN